MRRILALAILASLTSLPLAAGAVPVPSGHDVACLTGTDALQCRDTAWSLRDASLSGDWGDDARIEVAPQGGVAYVPTHPGTVLALDTATGAELWRASFGGSGVYAILPTADGARVLVSGGTPSAVVALDAATGVELWRTGGAYVRSLAHDDANGVVYGGGAQTSTSWIRNGVVIALDDATGAELWRHDMTASHDVDNGVLEVAVADGGASVAVVGSQWERRVGFRALTALLDADTGAARSIAVAPSEGGWRAAMSHDGALAFVTRDAGVAALRTSDGSVAWSTVLPAGGIEAIEPSPDGARLLVTGWGHEGYVTAVLGAGDGRTHWLSTYAGQLAACSYARDAAWSTDGSTAFVTGYSAGLTIHEDFVTFAYDGATGLPLWSAREDSGASDYASGVVQDPATGRLLVTGSMTGGVGEFAVFAYAG